MNNIRANTNRLRRQLPYIPKTLKLVGQASGPWMVGWILILIAQGILPVAVVSMTREVVGQISGIALKSSGPGLADHPAIWPPVLRLGLLMLSGQLLQSFGQWVRTIQAHRVQDHMSGLIQSRIASLDLGFFDAPNSFDSLHRARMHAMSRPLALLEGFGSLCQHAITLAGMAAMLFAYSFWIPLILLAGTLPALLVSMRHAERTDAWWRSNTMEERRCEYYDALLTLRESAQEMRFFGLADHYRMQYKQLRARLRTAKRSLENGKLLAELVAGTMSFLTTGTAMLWMISRTIAGLAGIGDIVFFYQAFGQGQRLMGNLLRNTGDIYQNMLFLENLFELLGIAPAVCDPEHPLPVPDLRNSVCFEGVSFRYPGAERAILQDFNLVLKSGQIAAILGENGEGKTTIIKLLCRFYDPLQGRITVDGCDIRQLRQNEWRGSISVLFQEPVRYQASASENITHGDIGGKPSDSDVLRAAEASGARDVIERLPEGFRTVLGKWFGGAELSAGEWQRVALARAFLRKAKLIILDEPTSLLDLWSESAWFPKFRELAEGCTVLIISHRLTTIMQADVIHVMRHGQVVESGTHDELLEMDGRYRHLWESRKALSVA